MRKDYMREYYEMLKRIAKLLVVKDVPKKELKKSLSYIEEFNLDIQTEHTEYEYILNLSNLTCLYEELIKYPDREEDVLNKDNPTISFIENVIYNERHNLDKKSSLKQRLYVEIITCITILATLISIPVNYFKSDANKKKVYFTTTSSYMVIEDLSEPNTRLLDINSEDEHLKSNDVLLHEYYQKHNGILTASSEYQEVLPYISNYIVKTYYPWNISEGKATRLVTTYEITDESLYRLFDLDKISYLLANHEDLNLKNIIDRDYELSSVLANSKQTTITETRQLKDIPKVSLVYDEPYDEFIIYNQNLDDYMQVNDQTKVIDGLLLLFETILLYAISVEIFENLLLVNIVEKIIALAMYYKLNSKEKAKLHNLLAIYQNIISNEEKNNMVKKRVAN